MRWFWTPFFAQKKEKSPEDLPVMSRLSTVESDLLQVRGDLGKVLQTVKTLQGKIYRGVQLGETSENVKEVPPAPMESLGFSPSKQDLYAAAAKLRRH